MKLKYVLALAATARRIRAVVSTDAWYHVRTCLMQFVRDESTTHPDHVARFEREIGQ